MASVSAQGSPATAPPADPAGPSPRVHFGGLDGLRGIAALLILLSHVALYARPAVGAQLIDRFDVGVPLFFVLSGFLIYRPWVAAAHGDRPPVSWRRYARARVLRLVPAYWVALGLVAAVPFLTDVFPTARAVFDGGDWWRYFGFVQVYDARTAGLGFAHAWTLCVEASFYVLVPFWALGWRRSGRSTRAQAVAVVALGLLSWAVRSLTYARPQLIGGWYPFAQTMGGTFLWFSVGMAAALVSVHRGVRRVPLVPAAAAWGAALALLVVLAFAAGLPAPPRGPSAVDFVLVHGAYAVIAGLMVVPFTTAGSTAATEGRVGAVLRSWPLRQLGEVSYGVYLWHPFAILALIRLGVGTGSYALLALATASSSILLGTLSYRLVEQPARRLR